MWTWLQKKSIHTILLVIALTIISSALHIFPFIAQSHNPLGYDTGFYRRYLTQPVTSFPNAPVPGLGTDALIPRIIFDIGRLIHLSPEIILYGGLITVETLLPILLFFLLSKISSRRIAIISALLFVLSPIQYTAYWFILWKSMWALFVLFTIFLLFEYKKIWPLFIAEAILALSHKTTAIIYLSALFVVLLCNKGRRKEMLGHIAVTGAFFVLGNMHSYVLAQGMPAAIFLEWQEYIGLSLAVVIGAVVGLITVRKKWRALSTLSPFIAFLGISLFFPIFQLPFYQRIFIFSDLAIIALAGYGIDYLLMFLMDDTSSTLRRSFYGLLLCIIIGLGFGTLWRQVHALQPLISDQDIIQIEAIGQQVPVEATILTTSEEAPWFEGWTLSHIAAPGMLHDRHNLEAWTAFWSNSSSTERAAFLNDFKKPLYISTLGDIQDLIGTPPQCVISISPGLWRDDCTVDSLQKP